MLLRNFYTALTANLSSGANLSSDITPEYIAEHLRPSLPNGTTTYYNNNFDLLPTTLNNDGVLLTTMPSEKYPPSSIILSSSDDEVNYTDYSISPLLYDDGSTVSLTGTQGAITNFTLNEDGSISATRRIVAINSQTKQATIRQWGIVKGVSSYQSSRSRAILVYKEKLATPFILNPSETINIDVTVKIYPAKPVS